MDDGEPAWTGILDRRKEYQTWDWPLRSEFGGGNPPFPLLCSFPGCKTLAPALDFTYLCKMCTPAWRSFPSPADSQIFSVFRAARGAATLIPRTWREQGGGRLGSSTVQQNFSAERALPPASASSLKRGRGRWLAQVWSRRRCLEAPARGAVSRRVPQTGLKVNRAITGPYYCVKITHRLPQPSAPDNSRPVALTLSVKPPPRAPPHPRPQLPGRRLLEPD